MTACLMAWARPRPGSPITMSCAGWVWLGMSAAVVLGRRGDVLAGCGPAVRVGGGGAGGVLAVWGEGDPIFGPDGARAFAKDAADAEIHLLDGGHFLLETHVDEVAGLIDEFLQRRVA